MKKIYATLGVSALLLTGCGTAASTPATAPAVAPAGAASPAATAATTAAVPEAAKSVRGNLIKTVGQPSSETYKDATIANFVVKSIEVDAKCTSKYAPTPKGHIVIMTVDAQTTPELANSIMKTWSLNMFGWKAIAENGTTVNGSIASIGCIESTEGLPSSMGPAEKATGKIAFDVPSTAGTLVYTSPGASAGWEWAFPAK